MNKRRKGLMITGISLVAAFVLWTLLVSFVDVAPIGPKGTSVGFSTMNGYVHSAIGSNMLLYTVTDWLGLVPIGFALGFAVLGLIQWIKRRHLCKVDRSILVLGVFYLIVAAVYLLFEFTVINYRPILIGGSVEASYPSSTTMLVICVMSTAAMQLYSRIKNAHFKWCLISAIIAFTVFMVLGRIISGVHWISDIIGGVLISAGLVMLYGAIGGSDM